MRVSTDDELHTVNAVFLGPKGWLLPFHARYVSYGIAMSLMLAALSVERALHLHVGFWMVAWTVVGVVGATRLLGTLIDYERPFRSVAVTFWHEVSAPRQVRKGQRMTVRPASVRTRGRLGRKQG